jgi:hypothetical protein
VEIAWAPPAIVEATIHVASATQGEIAWAPPPTAAEAVCLSVSYPHVVAVA